MKYKLVKPVIEKSEYNGKLYDIQVAQAASFTTSNGLIVHNSMCSTRVQTGFGLPQITAIMHARRLINGMKRNTAIIADGGIKTSGDIVKALAAGANSVMIGNLLAGTNESSGKLPNGNYKYRGQSSAEFNRELGKNVTPEGVAKEIPPKGVSAKTVVAELVGGIKSGMSYCNARNLKELNTNSVAVVVTNHGYFEGTPHGL